MRRLWLIFSQAVTVAVAVLFVVATLRPDWLRGRSPLPGPTVPVYDAPAPELAGSAPAPSALSTAARAAMPAVVSVAAQRAPARNPHENDPFFRHFFGDADRRPQPQIGLGSGVIVSPAGYLLTNHHVIDGAEEIQVRLADGREARAVLVGTDPETDVAVLKVDLPRLPVIALGDAAGLEVGDTVLAIGNPFNVGMTVTAGIISGLNREGLGLSIFENFIQTDAAINKGNSGGALVDGRGALVGINTAIYSESGGSVGIGFAVPVDMARNVMESLVRDGRVIRGWIGVEPRDLTPEVAESLDLPVRKGVLITGVLQGGPASEAGLKPGDVVVRIGARPVTTTSDLLKAVAALAPDTRTPVAVQRGARALEIEVTVAQRPPARQR